MVHIKKNNIVLEIPRSAYEVDYKNYGWEIIGEEKQQVEKQVASPKIIKNEKVEHNINNNKKNK